MLDVSSGHIAYAVLSTGGFIGIGDMLFAVPWHALTLDPENHCFILDVAKEATSRRPASTRITGLRWPIRPGATRSAHVYGQRPYWE